MNRLILAALFLTALLAGGCADDQKRVQQTGRGINLMPTTQEQKGTSPWDR